MQQPRDAAARAQACSKARTSQQIHARPCLLQLVVHHGRELAAHRAPPLRVVLDEFGHARHGLGTTQKTLDLGVGACE